MFLLYLIVFAQIYFIVIRVIISRSVFLSFSCVPWHLPFLQFANCPLYTILQLWKLLEKAFFIVFHCCPLGMCEATRLTISTVTALPHCLYLCVSLILTISPLIMPSDVQSSGKPCSLSHSFGVNLRMDD